MKIDNFLPADDSTSSRLLQQIVVGGPVSTFVVDAEHRVVLWNRACELMTGKSAKDMLGTCNQWQAFYPDPKPVLADLIVDGCELPEINQLYDHPCRLSEVVAQAIEVEDNFPFSDMGRWLLITAAPLRDSENQIIGAIETLHDITLRYSAEQKLREERAALEEIVGRRTAELAADIKRREIAEKALVGRNAELTALNLALTQAQEQLLQSEKMASIGQLAAGIAHEINNPVGFVNSNMGTLGNYVETLCNVIEGYDKALGDLKDRPAAQATIAELKQQADFEFLREDVTDLVRESLDGLKRVKDIVQSLKDFAHIGESDWQFSDLHAGVDSTLNIAANEIKYKAKVVKEYGSLPLVKCLASQLNQVFMSLIVNAAHAITESGTITIRTGSADGWVWVSVQDTGQGIPDDIKTRIFDPFFTTKPVGKGTGLGLTSSYNIVSKHGGRIEVDSVVGAGSTFTVHLPQQPALE